MACKTPKLSKLILEENEGSFPNSTELVNDIANFFWKAWKKSGFKEGEIGIPDNRRDIFTVRPFWKFLQFRIKCTSDDQTHATGATGADEDDPDLLEIDIDLQFEPGRYKEALEAVKANLSHELQHVWDFYQSSSPNWHAFYANANYGKTAKDETDSPFCEQLRDIYYFMNEIEFEANLHELEHELKTQPFANTNVGKEYESCRKTLLDWSDERQWRNIYAEENYSIDYAKASSIVGAPCKSLKDIITKVQEDWEKFKTKFLERAGELMKDKKYSLSIKSPLKEISLSSVALTNYDPKLIEWFKGSKVVDDKGNPLKVYHSTNTVFDKFDKSKITGAHGSVLGTGFYFATEPDNQFGKYTNTYYLRVVNPYNASKPVNVPESELYRVLGKNFKSNPYVLEKLNQKRGLVDLEGFYGKSIIRDLGYDGIYYSGGWMDNEQWVVFEPEQIWKIQN